MFRSFSQSSHRSVLRHPKFANPRNLARSTPSFRCALSPNGQTKSSQQAYTLQTQATSDDSVPFGKQLKNDYKQNRKEKSVAKALQSSEAQQAKLASWDLIVGLEIHAQLNTEVKLFSSSRTSIDDPPNANVSFFDLAFPGSQPAFQAATVIPALRAAIALNCGVQHESTFDRKHYFYPDQPAGYQITQYYHPFAKDGKISLQPQDCSELTDNSVDIGIKQIQLEQDTAKSISQPPSTTLVDFNRVGHPLIEIITLPEIHSPQIAAACARKVQSILQSVNAVFAGMEMGGLRVDVNVSVRPKGSTHLGQRTEIKNLSSFKAIEQAIIAERDRQIEILENGGTIAGETRGWVIGDTVTKKLRGKEGEVDYRYMPDPDIHPLLIDEALINHIRDTLPSLPDKVIADLVVESGLTFKDAKTLVILDDGHRIDYFDDVCAQMQKIIGRESLSVDASRMIANWVIHELGGLLSSAARSFNSSLVPAASLAIILVHLQTDRITGTSAKRLLSTVFQGDDRDVESIIKEEGMFVQHLSDTEYLEMARTLVSEHPQKVAQIKSGQVGKMKFFVGQMIRMGEGNVNAIKAENALKAVLRL